uniref:Uncharacterized protein n=1 Tax=Steinernema glaseri TaxID=37863 RepID=A0A1I7YVT6_9BILA
MGANRPGNCFQAGPVPNHLLLGVTSARNLWIHTYPSTSHVGLWNMTWCAPQCQLAVLIFVLSNGIA